MHMDEVDDGLFGGLSAANRAVAAWEAAQRGEGGGDPNRVEMEMLEREQRRVQRQNMLLIDRLRDEWPETVEVLRGEIVARAKSSLFGWKEAVKRVEHRIRHGVYPKPSVPDVPGFEGGFVFVDDHGIPMRPGRTVGRAAAQPAEPAPPDTEDEENPLTAAQRAAQEWEGAYYRVLKAQRLLGGALRAAINDLRRRTDEDKDSFENALAGRLAEAEQSARFHLYFTPDHDPGRRGAQDGPAGDAGKPEQGRLTWKRAHDQVQEAYYQALEAQKVLGEAVRSTANDLRDHGGAAMASFADRLEEIERQASASLLVDAILHTHDTPPDDEEE